jgi:hypothetical protein
LKPLRWDLLAGVYRSVVNECKARGVPAIWVLIPRVGKPADPTDRKRLMKLAKASGFTEFIDIADAFDGLDPASIAVSPNDFHPNEIGHARLARRLEAALGEITTRYPTHTPDQSPREGGETR